MKTGLFILLLLSFQAISAVAQQAAPARRSVSELKPVELKLAEPAGVEKDTTAPPAFEIQVPPVAPAGTPANTGKSAIQFERLTYDFGKVKQGDPVKFTFKFTNNGTGEVKLEQVRPSCGCTTPAYPKEPIPAGNSAGIDVKFDTNGKMGPQSKTITVRTSETDNNLIILTIKGDVLAPNPPSTGGK